MRHTESVQHEVISPGESSSEQLIHTRVPSSVGIPQGPSGAAQARQISVTSSKGLVLKAIASKETWIMIRADDGQAIEATLKADEEYVWKAKEKLSLRVGNAGGVSLTLNDKPLGPLGPEGKVVGIVFTAP